MISQAETLSRIPQNQASRRIPTSAAKGPYTPQTGQVAGGSGAVEMLVNGGFSGSSDGWAIGVAGTYADNAVTVDGAVSEVVCSQIVEPAVVSQNYRVTYNIVSITSGALEFVYGGAVGTARTAAGMYAEDITATSTSFTFLLGCAGAGCIGVVDSVSLRKI